MRSRRETKVFCRHFSRSGQSLRKSSNAELLQHGCIIRPKPFNTWVDRINWAKHSLRNRISTENHYRAFGGASQYQCQLGSKPPRIDTFFQNTISHRLSPVPPQRRRMPWPRPTVLTASPSGRITSPPGRYRT